MTTTRSIVTIALVAAAVTAGGCDEPAQQGGAQRLTAPPPGVSQEETIPGAPSLPQPGPGSEETSLAPNAASPAPAAPSAPLGKEAFLAANQRVIAAMTNLMKTLDGLDEASAQGAGAKLADLTAQWKQAAETATQIYLTLSDEQQDAVMQEAAASANAKTDAWRPTHGADIAAQIQRVARSPAGPHVERELVGLRDALLTTRGPYSPLLARKRWEEKLGGVGSPLKTN